MAEDYTKVRGSGKDYDRYAKMSRKERDALRDNRQAPEVFDIPTDTEKYDLDRMRYHSVGTKGYSREAFDYDY